MQNEHSLAWWACAGLMAAVLLWLAKPIAEILVTIIKWLLGKEHMILI